MSSVGQTTAENSLIARLKGRDLVVLSPHFDDACLSLGSILLALGQGALINIFTRSLWLKKSAVENPPEDYVRSIRDAEDRAFAERCGLIRYDLNCCEPAIVGRKPLDPSTMEEDVKQTTAALMAKLDELAATEEKKILVSPSGIGLHVNHRATVEIVLRNLNQIRRRYDVLFYEDQPYASNLYQRTMGVARLRRRLQGSVLKRNVVVPDWTTKKELIAFYPSQFPDPVSRRKFRPAALWPWQPHEALWSVE